MNAVLMSKGRKVGDAELARLMLRVVQEGDEAVQGLRNLIVATGQNSEDLFARAINTFNGLIDNDERNLLAREFDVPQEKLRKIDPDAERKGRLLRERDRLYHELAKENELANRDEYSAETLYFLSQNSNRSTLRLIMECIVNDLAGLTIDWKFPRNVVRDFNNRDFLNLFSSNAAFQESNRDQENYALVITTIQYLHEVRARNGLR